MNYLIDQMFVYILLAIIVAALIDIIVIEGRNDALMLFMIILGGFTGWISYILVVFITGGLARFDIWMMTLPIILTSLVSIYVLLKYANVKVMFRRPRWKVGKYSSFIALLVLVFMLGSFAVLAVYPIDLEKTNPENVTYKVDGRFVARSTIKISSDLARVAIKDITSSAIPITIKTARSYVNFPRISENPEEGQYLNFQVYFTVSSGSPDWTKPYCKIWIFKDENNNGQPDSSDTFVSPLNYKFPTNTAGKFRNNIAWESNVALYQVNLINIGGTWTPLPCFYGDISVWKNDAGQTVQNTPEKYTIPNIDMMSWEKSGSGFTLKESLTGYSVREPGEYIVVAGKMYCPDGSAGHYGIVYQAFDARYTEPYDAGETPLAQKIDLFEILEEPNGPNGPDIDITTSSWVTGLILGSLVAVGSVATWIKGPKMLLKK